MQAAAILAAALLCAGCGGELSASALSKQADSLRSLAAEGALLAEDSSAGKTTHTFTRVHSSDLDKAASKAAASLETAKTKPALESELHRLASLAQTIIDYLDQRYGALWPRDPRLRAIGRRLEAEADLYVRPRIAKLE